MKTEQGAALIIVMFVMALVVSLLSRLISNNDIIIQYLINITDRQQSKLVVNGAIDWVKIMLKKDLDQNKIDSYQDAWAQEIHSLPALHGQLQISITDAQSFLNINNLLTDNKQNQPYLTIFKTYFETAGLNSTIVTAMKDWTDPDEDTRYPNGAEDNHYLSKTPAYYAANQRFFAPGEMIWLEGWDSNQNNNLLQYLTALPKTTKININTAKPAVLQALIPGLNPQAAESIHESIKNTPLESVNELTNRPELSGLAINPTLLTVKSDYFFADITATFNDVTHQVHLLLQRNKDNIKTLTKVEIPQ